MLVERRCYGMWNDTYSGLASKKVVAGNEVDETMESKWWCVTTMIVDRKQPSKNSEPEPDFSEILIRPLDDD
jgi:hypothetical protein